MTLPSQFALPRAEHRTAEIDPAIVQGIRQASRATHVDFGYLMAQAAQESSFQPDAKARSSSATGLYQFIDSTWLDMVRRHGAQYGIADLAAQVTVDGNGRPAVADAAMRGKILDLRKDPRLSAALAAEFAKSNKEEVEKTLGRPASSTDLYLAHFLGAGGASELLRTIQQNGAVKAADILPEAAAANRAVFYDAKSGEARSVADIYRSFAARIEHNAADFAETAAPSVGAAAPASPTRAMAAILGRSLAETPLSGMFNAMLLAALKLIGGRSEAQPAAGTTAAIETRRHST
jgi:hypothetical protein